MSERDPRIALEQMLAHAREARALIQGKTRQDVEGDRVLSLALVRLLEVTGEAATRVSPEVRVMHPAVPWSGIIRLRNRLIHGYDTLNFDILWNILTGDVPALIAALERILSEA